MFVDKATITVKAGDGGNGCCSFHREKFVPRGGPDGGDGGAGGNVILEATNSEQSLQALVYNRHYQAQNGPGGKGSNLHGRKAPDITLKVPVGTVVTDRSTGEVIADMDEAGRQIVVAAADAADAAIRVSPRRPTARRASGSPVNPERSAKSASSSRPSRMSVWSAIRTPANRRCSGRFRLRGRRSRHIRSQRCIRSSASSNTRITPGSPWPIFRDSSRERMTTSGSAMRF